MRLRTGLILAVAGGLAFSGGWYFGPHAVAVPQGSISAGSLAFPGLAARLAKATRIEITEGGKTLALGLHNGVWGIAARGYYPAQQTKVHELLAGLAELRLVEQRTADPAFYARLGVEDPNKPGAGADLVRVLDAEGKPLAAIIVGHRSVPTQGGGPDSLYVRLPGEARSWLAEGHLSPQADMQEWFDRDIANIDHGRIASVSVTREGPAGAQHLGFTAKAGKLELTDPAEHPPLEESRVHDIARALELLTFTDVQEAKDIPGQRTGETVFRTKDGLTVTVTGYENGKDFWVELAATGTGTAEAEAKQLSARISGWAYQLGSWKEPAILPTLGYLTAKPQAAPATPPAGLKLPGLNLPGLAPPGQPAPAAGTR
jgi:hypothetical protein